MQLNYLFQFIEKYNNKSKICKNKKNINRPIFAFNWLNELSHNDLNLIQQMDDDLVNFLTSIEDLIDNSFVFIFSDHGIRFTDIVQTEIGEMEKNLPFFSLKIPKQLLQYFPQLKNILQNNSNVRLILNII